MEAVPDESEAEPPKDRPFNPWRVPTSDRLKAVASEAITLLQNYERYFAKRKRARRPVDQATFEATVTAILCDLIHHRLVGAEGGIFITRSHDILGKKSRYRSPVLSKTLPYILDIMEAPEMAFVQQELGHDRPFTTPKRTTIGPGERTLSRIDEHSIKLSDIGLSDDQEVIILKESREDHREKAKWIEYPETEITRKFRQQVKTINQWLAEADIDFDDWHLVGDEKSPDIQDRHLRRVFTQGRFDSGGRLFGGFWQSMKKKRRLEGVLIDEEPVVELDYRQMAPRIIYGLAGAKPDGSDLYSVSGFEDHRAGIKQITNAMLFATRRLERFPRGTKESFAQKHRIGDVIAAIETRHSAIQDRFFTGIGHHGQFIESQILVDVLLRLIALNLPAALPIHDAILVPSSSLRVASEVMREVFREYAGVEGLVSLEQ